MVATSRKLETVNSAVSFSRHYSTKTLLVILVFYTFLAGCRAMGGEQIYYWKGYSEHLYEFTKTPDKENKKKYQESLSKIIDVSEKEGKRVPPGIFAEYGYMMAQDGKVKEAARYFDMEEENYPESKAFISHLRERFIRFDLK